VYKIVKKQILSDIVKLVEVEAPHVARKGQAGQFVIVRVGEFSERIPLTIADYNRETGTITLIFQEVGKSTMEMGTLEEGDAFANVMGPLGHPTEIENFGTVICMGGGVGIAPIFPIARALKEAGNKVISIIAARTKELLIWEERMRSVSDELIICTDDGSYGRKGLITEPLKEILDNQPGQIAHIWAIGPAIMMKFVTLATKPYNVPTTVSLNTVMVDGTGMCGGCRVLLDDGPQFVCVDGPEFDGHKVNWDVLLSRMQYYRQDEQAAVENFKRECNVDKQLAAMQPA
jgi:ferredoxin--NADP+ reductase